MQSPCKPPEFHQQDWSQFDFSRWHLDGATLDAAASAFAGVTEQLFNSEEWQRNFKSGLPSVEKAALGVFKDHSQKLREQRKVVAEDFDKRIAVAQRRNDDFRKSVEAAAAPPVVQASPNLFHLAVRVAGKDASRGLPGLVVQIVDPRGKKLALAQAVTDENGNAVLTVPEDAANHADKADAALEVLSPEGKVLLEMPNAVCMRVNQVETKVVGLKDSPETASHESAALAIRSERDARAGTLAARIETLKQERQGRLRDLDCRLQDNEAIIASLEAAGGAPQPPEPEPSKDTPPAQSEPSKKESPPREGSLRRKASPKKK